MTTWTESELAEVEQLCKTLPLVEAWSIVACEKIAGLQADIGRWKAEALVCDGERRIAGRIAELEAENGQLQLKVAALKAEMAEHIAAAIRALKDKS